MSIRSFVIRAALALAISSYLVSTGFAPPTMAQAGRPNITPEEQSLFKSIMDAPDAAAKLNAGETLIKKYPRSVGRPRVARALADQISRVTDAAQKVTLAQEFSVAFKEPSEQQMIAPVLIDAFVAAKRFDEAFSAGTEFVSRNPDAILVLVQLLSVGIDQAKNHNPRFIPQSLQYGNHAIELIEADKKPADMDDAGWK